MTTELASLDRNPVNPANVPPEAPPVGVSGIEFRNNFRKSSLTLFRRLPLTDWLGELELEKGGKGGRGRERSTSGERPMEGSEASHNHNFNLRTNQGPCEVFGKSIERLLLLQLLQPLLLVYNSREKTPLTPPPPPHKSASAYLLWLEWWHFCSVKYLQC